MSSPIQNVTDAATMTHAEKNAWPPMVTRSMNSFVKKIRPALLGVPLRLKILGLAFGLIGSFSIVTISQVRQELNANLDAVLREESRFVARELSYQARDYLLLNDIFGLNRILANMVKNRPDLRYAFIVDNDGQVLAHTFGTQFPLDLLLSHRQTSPIPDESTDRLATNEGVIWDTQQVIQAGTNNYVRVGVKGDNLRAGLSSLIRALMRDTLIIAVLGGLLSLFLSWLIAKPVSRLLAATQKIRRGSYDIMLPVEANDEIGSLVDGFNAMARSLETGEKIRREKEALQKDFLQKLIAGQEAERKRIARELHDQSGQALASCMVELKIMEQAGTTHEQREGIRRLRKAITQELDALHGLAMDLRPSVLDDLGLIPALEMYARNFEKRHRIQVQLNILGALERRADPCLETCVYRIIQEAMTNIAKHARASKVTIFLEGRAKTLRGGVEDNGRGFAPAAIDQGKHMGIYGMRERVQLLGGTFHIDSDEGVGALISFEIPLRQEKCHEQNTNPDH
ncbi:ATP-binding protein [Thiovibrio sp. JS02]